MRNLSLVLCVLAVGVTARCACADGPVVRVGFDAPVCDHPVTGRLVVLMKLKGSALGDKAPLDGPFWEEEQALFAVDVNGLAPGAWIDVGGGGAGAPKVDACPKPLDELAPGEYEVQARLDTRRLDSDWKREGGNLFTKGRAVLVVKEKGGGASVDVKLDAVTPEPVRGPVKGVEWVSVKSKLLSKFRGRDVMMRAGVVLPAGFDASKQYAAVYDVPGFGGNDQGASQMARGRSGQALDRSVFWIVLDPEGPNGHTLFADSANNGPCGRALVEELIPALEKKFPLLAKPEARILRGHSSGGWSTLWLATEYPQVFGACWSSSPDPVDFRRFQMTDIYAMDCFYGFPASGLRSSTAAAAETEARKVPQGVIPGAERLGPDLLVSYRRDGKSVMTVEREAKGEDLLGPDNTSGQQWDSWFAVWGPRNEHGNPAALFDPATGLIDRAMAERYRKYDIADRLRKDPAKYAPIFRQRIRLVVGDADNFFLNEAVKLLKADLEKVPVAASGKKSAGYIKIVSGLDHSSIFSSKELEGFEGEMVEYLRQEGLAK